MTLKNFDIKIIHFFRRISMPVSRFGLFIIFFWFGLLKVIHLSPASDLVENLFEQTIPFMSFDVFIILFGLFEMLIGLLFLFKGFERIVIPLLIIHIATTLGPLIFLPAETWNGFLIPTLEGQYIIKNIAIMALAIGIASHLHPARNLRDMV